jgi:hypothetical protein
LESKPTTIEQDEPLLLSTTQARELRLAICFRMEEKKLLKEALEAIARHGQHGWPTNKNVFGITQGSNQC